ncbi:hypothetical protein ACFWUQ_08700 [Streptomyces sp. NPDC058662]|uniref:hypothetical protein n=1 Tax=Streptomyces sp. NPDC058662 TaxID=3346583 RepID=UPI0036497EC8
MSARRPLLTALGATTLLAALWFVPSAGATAPGAETPAGHGTSGGSTAVPAAANTAGTPDGSPTPREATPVLADTGSVDTAPYLLGGTLLLGVGAGFVTFSVHRSRTP